MWSRISTTIPPFSPAGPTDEITIAKNGGGAHLDLMTASYIAKAWAART